jgi:hypothetical protein
MPKLRKNPLNESEKIETNATKRNKAKQALELAKSQNKPVKYLLKP